MLKRIGLLLCVLALGMFLIGCGGEAKKPTPTTPEKTPAGATEKSAETTPTAEKPADKPAEEKPAEEKPAEQP